MIRRSALALTVAAVATAGTAAAQVADLGGGAASTVVRSSVAALPEPQARGPVDRAGDQRSEAAVAVRGGRHGERRGVRGEHHGSARHEGAVLDKLAARLQRERRHLAVHERIGSRMSTWFGCIDHVPVDQVGDIQHRWGFQYDERDGTGLDTRPALTLHSGGNRPDLLLLRLSRDRGCLSQAPDPNGTGEDARVVAPRQSGRPVSLDRRNSRGHRSQLRRLERQSERLDHWIDRVDAEFERFDEWESCLSWLPVTELGHEDQDLGYLFDEPGRPAGSAAQASRVAAVDIDASEWDDPDYELLAFLGRDRPFTDRECGHETGEGVDRVIPPSRAAHAVRAHRPRGARGDDQSFRDRLSDLRRNVAGAAEDIEDLLEPVQEFVQFDECMYTVGMRSRGSATDGYRYVNARGKQFHRSALSFDLRGLELPEMDIMAFSGEEAPQIECNEDAGGENTEE